jgi:hypothetical protein
VGRRWKVAVVVMEVVHGDGDLLQVVRRLDPSRCSTRASSARHARAEEKPQHGSDEAAQRLAPAKEPADAARHVNPPADSEDQCCQRRDQTHEGEQRKIQEQCGRRARKGEEAGPGRGSRLGTDS